MQIEGQVDLCGPELIEGWIYAGDEENVILQVFIGEELIGECVADRFREDLQAAGYGSGDCGFSFLVAEAHQGMNFSQTKLRLVGTPVYLLPSASTRIAIGLDDHRSLMKDNVE